MLAAGEAVSSSRKLTLVAQPAAPGRVRFGPFELDLGTGELRRNGEAVHLQQQPARVLALLVRQPGRLVTREELRRHLWGDDVFVDFQRGLNFCVMQIRDALGDDAETPRFVETLPRRGYRFIAPAEAVEPAGPPENEGPAAPTRPQRPAWRRHAPRAALVAALAVALGTAGWTPAGRHGVGEAAAASALATRVAVLPFEPIGGGDGLPIADGLTEEVIVETGRVAPGRLGVIARSSVERYAGGTVDLARVASELGVEFVMEGSVRREGGRVRVTARLVRCRDQSQVWAESYERTLDDVLGVQHEIARAAAGGIGIALDPTTRASASPPVPDPEAWRLYLLGRRAFDERTEEALGRARRHFEAAIAAAPGYAPAHAGLADVWSVLVDQGQVAPAEGSARAEAEARRALELDPASDAAHVSLAGVLAAGGRDLPAARRHLERALALNPSNSLARKWYCGVLADLGHTAEALEQARIGARADPLSASVVYNLGAHLVIDGRREEALGVAKHLLELDGEAMLSHLLHGRVLSSLGRVEEAIAALERAHRLDPNSPYPLEEMAFALRGRRPQGGSPRRVPDAPRHASRAAVHQGRRRRRGRDDRRARGRPPPPGAGGRNPRDQLFYVAKCAPFALLRGDPRFAAIEKRIAAGLPPAGSGARS